MSPWEQLDQLKSNEQSLQSAYLQRSRADVGGWISFYFVRLGFLFTGFSCMHKKIA